ncbi:TadE/TadG family type IV pilus assembly protein [Mesorhizobium sp. B1-1-5]|uniref:TadE/TadG family type IV pilus assembly protein n=1 Tax=Mesorhizobium sp. B1-1-5 TaxID=2589979 RepID=UPI001FEFF651|nr:TadE/TadG family type IV pilus assembly protein [Mesorhizobium sp. B1-1-5]
MVEMTIVAPLLFALTFGFVDFGYALYQWNGATKAVQIGARLASISDPVVSTTALANAAPSSVPGAPVAAGSYSFVCKYTVSTGACKDQNGTSTIFDTNASNAFSRIFRGDTAITNDDACPALTGTQRPGMCHFLPGLKRSEVVITYSATGLGFQTRLGGPVPTITVELQNRTFQFFFLSGLMGFGNINMPSMLSTVTGEDLKTSAPT